MNAMNWLVVYPEALLLLMACVVALVDLFVTDPLRRPTFWLTQLSLVAVAALHLAYYDGGATVYGMQRMLVSDPMGHLLAFFATVAVIITIAYAQPYIASRDMLKGEYFTLSMFVLLGIG
jgi:NADH-quinone oxidoreductase subunit N